MGGILAVEGGEGVGVFDGLIALGGFVFRLWDTKGSARVGFFFDELFKPQFFELVEGEFSWHLR